MLNNNAIYVGVSGQRDGLSPHEYAESCQLYAILSEITRVVARKNNLNVNNAVSDYLNQCNKGEHVVLKSYSSFSKSSLNRQCFLYSFSKIFEIENNNRNGLDYYQLFRLLCSDFPKEIISNSVKLLQGNNENNMSILLNSTTFLNGLYINFIYYEYLEAVLQKVFSGEEESSALIIKLYKFIKEEDGKKPKLYEQPPVSFLFEIIICQISKKGYNKIKGLTFLNESSIDSFIDKCLLDEQSAIISYQNFCEEILNSKAHQIMVQNNLNCFDNNSSWASEVGKLLNHKENDIQPLNSKKMKSKK